MKTHLLMMRKAVLIGSVFLLFFATGAIGATYYVATTGSDTNPGTEASPWRNIQKAADTMVAGDTCIVKDGTYTDSNNYGAIRNCIVIIRRDGTPTNWITFRAENTHGAVLNGNNSRTNAFYLYRTNYIRIEGFEIRNTNGGIHINGSHDIYMYQCKIHDIGRYYTSSDCSGYATAFAAISSDANDYNVTVDGCRIYDIGRQHQATCCAYDYMFDHLVYAQGKGWLIKNNIIYNAHSGFCIKLDGHYGSTSDPTHIITNNTFGHDANDGYARCGVGAHGDIWVGQSHGDYRPHDVIIQSNVFYNPPGLASIRARTKIGDMTLRNNVTSSTSMMSAVSDVGDPTEANNTTSLSLTSFGMTDPENNDFTLKASASYLINRGIATSAPDKDYTGIARPQDGTYDIGAYEYAPPDYLLAAPQKLRFVGP